MPRSPIAVLATLLVLVFSGCSEHAESANAPAHPNLIIVREFAAPLNVVTLDPSFGFSLHRGTGGVAPTQRGASVARAAAFTLADTVVEQLRAFGYDAIRSNEGGPEPGARAMVVTGAFRSINEGYRRQVGAEGSGVAADIEVDYQDQSARPRRLMSFQLDSRQVAHERIVSAAVGRGETINAASARLGAAIARTVADLAQRNRWPGAPH